MNWLAIARTRAAALYLLLFILITGGIFEARRLASSIFPPVTFPIVKVIADVGGEPAARMMPTVTRPLEEAILRVPGIHLVRSTTSRGSTEISAQFDWGTDMQAALQRVQAEAQRVRPDLPPNTRVDVEWMNTAVFPIQGYALTSDTRSQAELRELAQYTLRPALSRIPGISQVQIQGGSKREFQVRLDPQALEGRQLSAADVISALQKNNDVLSAGLTEANHELYLTLVSGRVHNVESLGTIAVSIPGGGPPALLSELAQIGVEDQVSYVRTTADGHPAVLINIVRQPSANTVAIADGVKALFIEQPDLLPKDVRWSNFYDQAQFVADSIHGVRDAIIIGVALAALVLLLFLRRWRLALIAVAAIPLTLGVVVLGLSAIGQTINLMTLAGAAAAVGLIADDMIVMIENIHSHAAHSRSEDAVERGAREILPALVGSSLSTTVILLPFALLSGVVGAFFKPLALTMALSLVVSFFLAALVVPVSVAVFDLPTAAGKHSRLHRFTEAFGRHGRQFVHVWAFVKKHLTEGYRHLVRFFVTRAVGALIALPALIGAGYVLYSRIGTDFLPNMDESSIILDYWTPPGTSLTDSDQMLRAAESIILSLPDVQSYSRRTGAQLGFFITEPNRGDYVIKLKPRTQRRPIDKVIDDLRSQIGRIEPAIHTDFGQLLEDNIGDLTGGVPQPIDIKIFGGDQALLEEKAKQLAQLVASVKGIHDVFDGIVIAGPELRIDIDSLAAARFGMTTRDIHAAIEPAVTGTVAGQIRVGERMYDLRVFARQVGPLKELRIRAPAPSSALIPLKTVALPSTGKPEAEIHRENLKTYLGVTARLSGRDLGSAMAEVRQRVAQQFQLSPGTWITYGGLYEQQQQSFRGLLYVLLAGLVLVSAVILFEFGDWRAPLVSSLSAIAGLAGVFLALIFTGTTLNISSYVGAIMMVGIVGENAIFIIHEARTELNNGLGVKDAWMKASERRLRPVAMTILATTLALAPLALGLGQGSQLMQPLAIAVIGGFVLSGPIVLLVVPGLYRFLDPRGQLASKSETASRERP